MQNENHGNKGNIESLTSYLGLKSSPGADRALKSSWQSLSSINQSHPKSPKVKNLYNYHSYQHPIDLTKCFHTPSFLQL